MRNLAEGRVMRNLAEGRVMKHLAEGRALAHIVQMEAPSNPCRSKSAHLRPLGTIPKGS